VDEGVDAVDPVQQLGAGEEPALEGQLPEDVQALLEVDELQGVAAGDVDGALDEREGREGAADLVYLEEGVSFPRSRPLPTNAWLYLPSR
jgi:hypothetical protein